MRVRAFLFIAVLAGMAWGADFSSSDTTTVEIWSKHDLGYVADTVEAIMWWPCGNGFHGHTYYLRTTEGDRWSDREPITIKQEAVK
jgi:hypothetical protein